MKIIIILVLVCMLALGAVGAVGFFSKGFTSFDKGEIKQQINSLKESVQDLTNKVKDAYQTAKQQGNEEQSNCPHENIDENGVCQDCGQCTHKYVFGGECQGCHKSIDEIRANCEHQMDGCRCTKCGYENHDVDPETYTCRNCGMLVINTNSVCLNGHADKNGDGRCDYCGAMVQPEPEPEPQSEPEPQPQEPYIVSIHQMNVPTYQLGEEVIPSMISIMVVYSDDTNDFVTPDSIIVDTSTAGEYIGNAYYGDFSCEFTYVVEGEEEGPTGSGEQMVEEDGEW